MNSITQHILSIKTNRREWTQMKKCSKTMKQLLTSVDTPANDVILPPSVRQMIIAGSR